MLLPVKLYDAPCGFLSRTSLKPYETRQVKHLKALEASENMQPAVQESIRGGPERVVTIEL